MPYENSNPTTPDKGKKLCKGMESENAYGHGSINSLLHAGSAYETAPKFCILTTFQWKKDDP